MNVVSRNFQKLASLREWSTTFESCHNQAELGSILPAFVNLVECRFGYISNSWVFVQKLKYPKSVNVFLWEEIENQILGVKLLLSTMERLFNITRTTFDFQSGDEMLFSVGYVSYWLIYIFRFENVLLLIQLIIRTEKKIWNSKEQIVYWKFAPTS